MAAVRAEQYIKIHKKAFTISINKHTTYFDMERAINFWVSTTRTYNNAKYSLRMIP